MFKTRSLTLNCILSLLLITILSISWNGNNVSGQETYDFTVKVTVAGEQGRINWTQGYIEAKGMAVPPDNITSEAQGKLLARRGAILDAQRRLLEIIKGVRVKGKTTMVNLMANDVVRQEVNGYIKGAVIISDSEQWHSKEKFYELLMRVHLRGLYGIVHTFQREDYLPEDKTLRETSYTGLVVDARGTTLTPQVRFRILDTSGQLIYGAAKAFYQVAADQGLAGWVSASVESAIKDPRVGNNPLVIEAKAAGGDFNTDLIVSVEDGQEVLNLLDGTEVFAGAKVIVVAD